jgi:4-amino-4-deoxy-L-arabinose transferase-like glycosyltransferase
MSGTSDQQAVDLERSSAISTTWIQRHGDSLIALGLGLGYLACLLATCHDLGYARDEGFYFQASESYARWFALLAESPSQALTQRSVDAAWSINPEHPPLLKSLFGLSWLLLYKKLALFSEEGTSFRFPGMVLASAALPILYSWGKSAISRRAGLVAALAYGLVPTTFYHAHLACFDAPIATLWLAVAFAYARSLPGSDDSPPRPTQRWALAAGVLFGLALASKHNSWFLPFACGLHAWLRPFWSATVRADDRPFFRRLWDDVYVPKALFWMAILGPPILVVCWPRLYWDGAARFVFYVKFHLQHEYYNMEFLGRTYFAPPFPRAYAWLMTAATVPLVTLLSATIGFVVSWRNSIQAPADSPRAASVSRSTLVLWALGLFVNYLAWLSPGTPIFGGTKHWLTAYPFLCLFAGAGAEWALCTIERALRQWHADDAKNRLSRAVSYLCLASLLAAPAVETWHAHPWGLSAYSPLVGGTRGAADLGLNRGFWGYQTGAVVDVLNEKTPPQGSVYVHDTAYEAFRMLQRDGRLRVDIRPTGSPAEADVALYHHEQHMAGVEDQIWVALGTTAPAVVRGLDGVPIVWVYVRPRLTTGAPATERGRAGGRRSRKAEMCRLRPKLSDLRLAGLGIPGPIRLASGPRPACADVAAGLRVLAVLVRRTSLRAAQPRVVTLLGVRTSAGVPGAVRAAGALETNLPRVAAGESAARLARAIGRLARLRLFAGPSAGRLPARFRADDRLFLALVGGLVAHLRLAQWVGVANVALQAREATIGHGRPPPTMPGTVAGGGEGAGRRGTAHCPAGLERIRTLAFRVRPLRAELVDARSVGAARRIGALPRGRARLTARLGRIRRVSRRRIARIRGARLAVVWVLRWRGRRGARRAHTVAVALVRVVVAAGAVRGVLSHAAPRTAAEGLARRRLTRAGTVARQVHRLALTVAVALERLARLVELRAVVRDLARGAIRDGVAGESIALPVRVAAIIRRAPVAIVGVDRRVQGAALRVARVNRALVAVVDADRGMADLAGLVVALVIRALVVVVDVDARARNPLASLAGVDAVADGAVVVDVRAVLDDLLRAFSIAGLGRRGAEVAGAGIAVIARRVGFLGRLRRTASQAVFDRFVRDPRDFVALVDRARILVAQLHRRVHRSRRQVAGIDGARIAVVDIDILRGDRTSDRIADGFGAGGIVSFLDLREVGDAARGRITRRHRAGIAVVHVRRAARLRFADGAIAGPDPVATIVVGVALAVR